MERTLGWMERTEDFGVDGEDFGGIDFRKWASRVSANIVPDLSACL